MDFEELAWKRLELTNLAQNIGQKLMVLLKTVMKLRFTLHDTTRSASFWRRKCLMELLPREFYHLWTSGSTFLPTNFTCTRSDQSDYLSTNASTWLPAHEMVYLITCIYLVTCTRNCLSD